MTPDPNDAENVYPTHTCFDDVVEYMNELAKNGATEAELLEYTTVHAILIAPNGERFAHAWIEHAGTIIEGGIYKGERVWVEFSADEFRALRIVEDETRYSIVDCVRLDHERGLPPWEERYQALCGDGQRVWDVAFRTDAEVKRCAT